MKKIYPIILVFCAYLGTSAQTNCTLSASAASTNIVCGQSVQLTATGAGGAILMNNDFNNGTVGSGWSATSSAEFDNPCSAGPDGTTYLWMGPTTAAPRQVTTIPFNIACSGTISFDLVFAGPGSSPCEQPDAFNEGVHLAYSTDGGVTWTDIFYFDPTVNPYSTWSNYSFAIPAAAISSNTMFTWLQTTSSGNAFDHWGIDNVSIILTGACSGGPPYAYTWLPATGLSSTTIANPVATPSVTTTYTVYYTNGVDTCTVTLPTINVASPTADAGTMQAVCLGQSVVLNGSGASNLPANTTFINSNINLFVPDFATVSNTLTVSGLPYTTISTTSIDEVCIDSLDMTFDGDLTFTLFCPDGTPVVLSSNNGGGNDNYHRTCFTPTATVNITAGTAPFIGDFIPEGPGNLNSFTGCTANGNWTLQISDGAGADQATLWQWHITFVTPAITNPVWSPTTNMTGSTTFTPTVTPTVPGITQYTLTVNGNPGCSAVDTVSVQVNQLSGVVVSANDNVLCQSDTTTLHATGGITYSWTPATGLSSTSTPDPVANPNTTTNYTVTVSDGGCAKIDSVLVTVNQRPPTNAGPNVQQCLNDSTHLTASGANTYTWAPATALTSTTIANPVSGTTSSITYTVTGVITATGCMRTDSVTITVNPLPVANAGPDTSFCAGGNVTLNATGGGNYSWLPATNMSNSTVANPTVNPPATTIYTLTVTNSFNCIDRDTIQVTVHALPNVDAGANGFTCRGTPRQLTATGASTYVWTPAASLSNPNISNPLATPTVTTTYTVVGTDVYGCVKSDLVTVGIFTVATVSMNSSSSSVCPGGTATLTASGTPSSYTWSPAGTLGSVNGPSVVATPTATTTTYTVQFATPGNGCIGRDSITVSLFALPTADAGTDANICPTDSTTLSASGGTSYAWSPATGLDNAGISNPFAFPSSTTHYTVTVTDANGCTASDSVWVYARPNPVPGTMSSTMTGCTIPMGSVTMQVPSVGTAPFTYAMNGGSPQSSNTFSSLGSGYYVVEVTDSYGCSDTAGVAVTTAPNPVAGALSSTLTGCIAPSGSVTMQTPTGTTPFLYSLNGGSPQTSATFNNLAAGNYTVTVIDSFTCIASATVAVATAPNPTPGTITTTLSACTSPTGSVSMQTPPSGTAPFMYSLNGGTPQLSGTFTSLSPGSYTITVTDANGCSGSASDSVFQQSPPSTNGYTAVNATCTGANGSITAGFPTGGTAPYTFSINGGTPQSSTVFNGLTANQYTLTVIDINGCTDSEVATVSTTMDTISIDSVRVLSSTCGESTGSIQVVSATGGTGPYTYSDNDGTSYQTSSMFSNLISNNYTVIVKDANGCMDTSYLYVGANITVHASFDESPTSGVYPLTVNFTNTSTNATGYFWDYTSNGTNDATTANTSTTYTAAGTYTVQLIAYHNIQACADTTWQAVLVIDQPTLTIPNIITPNDDGQNDEFKLLGYNYKSFDVTIFDRWGKKVTSYTGDMNTAIWKPGSDVHEGTYFYIITGITLDDKTTENSGYLTIMR